MLLVEQCITSEVVNNVSILTASFGHMATLQLNRRTIEFVEQEVERLFEKDALADDVRYSKLPPTYLVLSQYGLHRSLGQRKP